MRQREDKIKHPVKTIARWSVWSAFVCMAFVVAGQFLLPYLINTRPVKERILTAARAALGGQVDFDTLRLNIFPLPSVKLTRGSFRIEDRVRFRAERIVVYPAITPLLTGHVRIRRASVVSPSVEIQLPAGAGTAKVPSSAAPADLRSDLRSVISHLPRGIRLKLTDGALNLIRQGHAVGRFEGLDLTLDRNGQWLHFRVKGQSTLADRFQAQAQLATTSLDLKGEADLQALKSAALETLFRAPPGAPTVDANVQLSFKSAGLQTLQCDIAASAPVVTLVHGASDVRFKKVSMAGDLSLVQGQLQISLSRLNIETPRLSMSGSMNRVRKDTGDPSQSLHLVLKAADCDVTAWRRAMLSLAPDLARWQLFEIVQGGNLSHLSFEAAGASWETVANIANMQISGTAADARINIPGVDLDLAGVNGDWQLVEGVLNVGQAEAHLGSGTAARGTLSLGLTGETRPIQLRLDLDADMSQLPPVLIKVLPKSAFRAELQRVHGVQGNAHGTLQLSGTLAALKVDVSASDIRLEAEYNRLPATLAVHSGRFRFNGRRVVLEKIQADMGDTHVASLDGSVEVKDDGAARLSASGTVGAQSLQWLHEILKLPADFTPNAPVAVKDGVFSRHPDGRMVIEGALTFPQDMQVTGRLAVDRSGTAFDLSRLALSDDHSDTRITLRRSSDQKLWDASFDGRLEADSLLKIWPQSPLQTGWMEGHLAARISMADLSRVSLKGTIKAGKMLVSLETLGTVQIHQADLSSTQQRLTIQKFDGAWNKQQFSVSGDILFSDQKPQLALSITTDELDMGAIEKTIQNRRANASPSDTPGASSFNSPLTGRIRIDAGRLLYSNHTWDSVRAVMQISADQIEVAVKEATICGISTVGSVQWSPRNLRLALVPQADHQTLQVAGGCLLGGSSTERVAGTFNISGKITATGGTSAELLNHMQGQIKFDAASGQISNAGDVGLLTNILSYLRINKLVTGDVPDLKDRAFKFDKILLDLQIRDGQLKLNQADVRGETLNLVGEGSIDLPTRKLSLTVLVSPLTGLDTLVRHIPVVGKILKGTLIAIPVGVRGPLANPTVIPLSPRAVGDRLKGILERTLQAPFQLVEPLFDENK